jgi:hypothetical protein
MIDFKEARQLFILRRAFWVGKVKRSEVASAFGISDNQASLDLKHAVFGRWASFIRREGLTGRSGVAPIFGVQAPYEASASKMLSLFESHADYTETGLKQDELSLLICKNPVYRANNVILEVLMTACIQKNPIEILYVGLRKGEEGKWRQVVPNGMEFTGRQWRLIAQDLHDGQKQKTYVLPRILSAKNSAGNFKRMVVMGSKLTEEKYQVTLNAEMTSDQLTAISDEIGVSNGAILMNSRNLYEFKKLYCDDRSGLDGLVWPVVQDIKKAT